MHPKLQPTPPQQPLYIGDLRRDAGAGRADGDQAEISYAFRGGRERRGCGIGSGVGGGGGHCGRVRERVDVMVVERKRGWSWVGIGDRWGILLVDLDVILHYLRGRVVESRCV